MAPLGGNVALPTPLTQDGVRAKEAAVSKVRDALETAHGKPAYFQFAISDKRPVRAAQGYLVKFPRALVTAFPELRLARHLARTPRVRAVGPHDAWLTANVVNKGRMPDAKRNKAIEMHAVNTVMGLWKHDGYKVEDVGLKRPVGYHCYPRRRRSPHRGEGQQRNEGCRRSDRWRGSPCRGEPGDCPCGGGSNQGQRRQPVLGCRVRVWQDWAPSRVVLVPTTYRYPLPEA